MYRILFIYIFLLNDLIFLSHVCVHYKIRQVQCDLFSSWDLPDEVIVEVEGTDCKHHVLAVEFVEDQDFE